TWSADNGAVNAPFSLRRQLLQPVQQLVRRKVARNHLTRGREDRRRAPYTEHSPQLPLTGDRVARHAPLMFQRAVQLGERERALLVLRAPHLLHFFPGGMGHAVTRVGGIANAYAPAVVFLNLRVQTAAVSAIHVGKDDHGVTQRRATEGDQVGVIQLRQRPGTRFGTPQLGKVPVLLDVDHGAADEVTSIRGYVENVAGGHHLVKTGNRRGLDVSGSDARETARDGRPGLVLRRGERCDRNGKEKRGENRRCKETRHAFIRLSIDRRRLAEG